MTLLDDLIAFAKTQPNVTSVRKGREPEEGTLCWYLMARNPDGETRFETLYPIMLNVPEAVQQLSQKYGQHVAILPWPEIDDDKKGFLGEKVWVR